MFFLFWKTVEVIGGLINMSNKNKNKKKTSKKFNFSDTGIQRIDSVGRQLEKIFEQTNMGSLETRYRYFKACERFIKEIVPHFRLQKLANLQDKHLEYYANLKLAEGNSSKYVRTELSAIRFMHHITPNTRHELEDSKTFNKRFDFKPSVSRNIDRAWTDEEIEGICQIAIKKGRKEYADMIEFTILSGCRLNEVATLKRHHLEKALREGNLYLINTKGGRPRKVPVGDELRGRISELLPTVERGEYVFVPKGMKVHIFKRQAQDFLVKNRDDIQNEGRENTGHNLISGEQGALTWHGLRHTYAQRYYMDMRKKGYSDEATRKKLTEVLGHGRIEITYVYVPKRFAHK